MSNIQLVAIDVDGTLLNSQHEMTERTEAALKKAMEQGVKVVFATGKTRHSVNTFVERLNTDTPGIFLQGLAVYYPDGSIKHQQTLDPNVARRIITFAEDRGFDVVAYAGSRILVRRVTPDSEQLATKYHEPMPEAVGALQNILDSTAINKLLIIKSGDPRKIKALRWQLGMQLDNGTARLVQALPDMLEVVPPGTSKGKALKTVIRELGITAEHVLAIGDAENDLEMLELAGIGVAVGNAIERVRNAADHVVASNDEDGVAEALERFVLKPEEPETSETPETSEDEATPETSEASAEAETTTATTTPETSTTTADESEKTETKTE